MTTEKVFKALGVLQLKLVVAGYISIVLFQFTPIQKVILKAKDLKKEFYYNKYIESVPVCGFKRVRRSG